MTQTDYSLEGREPGRRSVVMVDASTSVELAPKASDWTFKTIIIIMLAIVVYATFAGRLFQPLFQAAKTAHWSKLVVRPSLLWGMMGVLLLTFRTIAWFRYRPFPSVEMGDAPSLTVIIPAYNEGPMVSIRS